MMKSALWISLAMVLIPATGLAQPEPERSNQHSRTQAATEFDRGRKLYAQGLFKEAIEAFSAAHRISPHQAAIFNIARCHENLGDPVAALEFYGKALALASDSVKRADILARMERIRMRPVDVLVSSRPPGASVTVDGRAATEPHITPTVVKLRPGEHVLLLRLEGHLLAAHRVEVKQGGKLKVEPHLEPLPTTSPAPPKRQPCPPQKVMKHELVDGRGLHVHGGFLAAVSLTGDRNLSAGPGAQVHVSYRRLFVGLRTVMFITEKAPLQQEVVLGGDKYNKQAFRRVHVELEGGLMFPFDPFYLYTTAGAGFGVDRIIFANDSGDFVKERFAFVWSLGGGIEAKATSWLSFGAALRFGISHGDRVNLVLPVEAESGSFPHGLFWGSVTLHL